MELEFCGRILQNENMDVAYVEVPYDIKELFGKGRLLVNTTFDGIPYRGQVVKMKTPCYIIGVIKRIRKQIGKSFGDMVEVVLHERDSEKSPMWQCPKCGGKVITLFILLLRGSTSACIRALQPSKNLLKH